MAASLSEVLDKFNVDYKTNRRSFILRYCPACGRNKNTVWMFRPEENTSRTGGQCWVCAHKFSSYTYLTMLGHEPKVVRKEMGIGQFSPDLDPESWRLPDFNGEESTKINQENPILEVTKPLHLMTVWDWPDHAASKYARSRGVCGDLGKLIYIDPISNAVAFPVEADGKLVGFQRRFVSPDAPFKVKTDGNLPKARSFIKIGSPEMPICVVEGPFDAVAAAWFGYYGVCTMGASLSKTQCQEIAIMAFNQNPDNPIVYIGLDNDEAGEIGARNLARLLDAYGVGFKRVLPDADFKDLGDALKEGSKIDFSNQQEFLNIEGPVVEVDEWHWSLKSLEGFKYKIGIDYTWADFKAQADAKAKNRQKYLNRLQKEDPERLKEILEKIKEREEKRTKRLKLEGIL